MANDPNALTNMLMANPWMFDPSQQSNKFSNFNNAAMPFPPTFNEGNAGGPVNAATGQPIQSYLNWKAANPGGMSINNTPAQPAPAPAQPPGMTPQQAWLMAQRTGGSGVSGGGMGTTSPQGALDVYSQLMAGQGQTTTASRIPYIMSGGQGPPPNPMAAGGAGPTGTPAATPQGSGAAPNNWYAALNALAQPGKVTTPGANVPMATGSQPAGGVNQAFLNQAQGQGMNPRFLSALGAIQGRPFA